MKIVRIVSPAVFMFLIFFLAHTVSADTAIFINEFQIEPDPQQVEIINIASTSANLSHWYLDDSGGTTYFTIPDGTTLFPNSCLVFTGDFNLNKSSADVIRLFDNTAAPTDPNAKLIDSFSYKSSSGSAVTYQRVPDGQTWTTEAPSLGKYNITRENCIVLPSPTPTPSPAPSATPTPTDDNASNQTSYDHIYISEVMAYPNSGENEWVELYNDNDYAVSLNKWYLDDVENAGSSPKQFSISISAKGYATFDFSTGIFNNDDDSIRLLDYTKNFKDGFEYSHPDRGLTLSRQGWNSDAYCITDATKSKENSSCKNISTPSSTPGPTKAVKASISQSAPTKQSTLPNYSFLSNNTILPDFAVSDTEPVGASTGEAVAGANNQMQQTNNSDAFQESTSIASFGLALLSAVSTILKLKAKIST